MFEMTRLSFHPIPQDQQHWPGYEWYATGSFSRDVESKDWFDSCHEEGEFLEAVAKHLGIPIEGDSESGQIWVYFKSMEDALQVVEVAEAVLYDTFNITPFDVLRGLKEQVL